MNIPLKNAFWEKGIRQVEVAFKLNIDPARLSRAVNGWLELRPEEKKAISEYLNKSEKELFPVMENQRATA